MLSTLSEGTKVQWLSFAGQWCLNDNNDHIERCNSRFSQSPHCAANCLQHVLSSGQAAIMCNTKSRVTHQALITCNMYAAWYKGTGQLKPIQANLFFWSVLYAICCIVLTGTPASGASVCVVTGRVKLVTLASSHHKTCLWATFFWWWGGYFHSVTCLKDEKKHCRSNFAVFIFG